MHIAVTVTVHNLINNKYNLYTNTHTYLWYYDIDIIMVIKVQIYIAVPFGESLLPALKSFTSHVKTGNFDLRSVSDK